MSVPTNPGAMLYTQGFGSRPENVEVPVYSNRDPSTASDVNYPIGKEWINVGDSIWKLLSLSTQNGITTANWVEVASNSGGFAPITSIVTEAGTIVADGSGAITLTGAASTTAVGADKVYTKNSTGAGTSTSGSIVMNPAVAVGGSSLANAGPASFANTQFAADANGFVTLLGGGTSPAVVTETVDTFTAPAVTAVVAASVTGDIRVRGASVAAGTNPVRSNSHAASEFTLEVQTSQAIAATDATKIGLAAFNSADFSVDANGFVSAIGNSTNWNVVSVNTAMDVNNGYIAVAPGGALTFSLPAASALGDIIELTLDGATSWQITQGAGQQIRFGNVETTAGVGGSITSTAAGDTIKLVCQTANLRWNVLSSIGALNVV